MAFYGLRFIPFVPRRASLIRPEKVRGLSERSEFPRAPAVSGTRRRKRDTGAFFWFRFLTRVRK